MIPCQRHLFDLPAEIAYLNCAYMSPILKRAAAVGAEAIARKCRPWTITAADFFADSERARALFAELLGASAEDVAIVPAASYGLAVAAANLPLAPGERILVLAEQFPSNVFAWRELAKQRGGEVLTIPRPADGDWTAAVLEELDERVGIAALPHCHWTDGGLLDLVAIGERCREVSSALVLDATQSLGALPLDLARVRPDYLVCAGYKWLLGPYSLGYLYVAPQHQGGRPLEQNWIAREASQDFARLIDYAERYQPGARRFDVGERSNFALLPVSIVGLEQLLAWGVPAIAATLAATDRGDRAACGGARARFGGRRPARRPLSGARLPRRPAGRPAGPAGAGAGPRQPARGFAPGNPASLQRRGRPRSPVRRAAGARLTADGSPAAEDGSRTAPAVRRPSRASTIPGRSRRPAGLANLDCCILVTVSRAFCSLESCTCVARATDNEDWLPHGNKAVDRATVAGRRLDMVNRQFSIRYVAKLTAARMPGSKRVAGVVEPSIAPAGLFILTFR